MQSATLEQEALLDVEFALSLWGDEEIFQRLLRVTRRSLADMPTPDAVETLEGEPLKRAGEQLHKYAGRVGVVGMQRLAAALRAVDHAVRADEPFVQPLADLRVVLTDTDQAATNYLAANSLPYTERVDPASVDRAALTELVDVLEGAANGTASTSAVDDAMEDLFDVVGEEPAYAVHEAVNADDMDALRKACAALRSDYLS